MRHGREAQAVPGAIGVVGVVDAADVQQLLEAQRRLVAQQAGHFEVVVGLDDQRQLANRFDQALHALAENLFERSLEGVQVIRHVSPCARWCWYA
ncbi:hypothetical protein D3C85_1769760 [compost metagenome]